VERENSPREPFGYAQGKHEEFSQIIASLSTVLCSTGTILRRKGNGNHQICGTEKVKTRTLENHKGAAPKFVLTGQGCATRLAAVVSVLAWNDKNAVQERKQKEKKADPFQDRKGRAPSLVEFQLQVELIALPRLPTSMKTSPSQLATRQ
jgi:hypothetical protein